MIATEKMLQVFVEAADTLVDEFDLIDFLQRTVDNTASISGTALVGLLLADENRRLQVMVSTSAATKQVELFQIQNDEGPCLDCFQTRRPVVAPDLDEAHHRWPTFVPNALAHGMRSVHAFPMRLRDRTIGTLNVFGAEPLPLSKQEIALVQSLADIATIAIIQERAVRAAEQLTEQLQGALNSRVVIEQAKGAVAQGMGVTPDGAFSIIRAHARHLGINLTDFSRAIAERTIDVADLSPVISAKARKPPRG